MVISNQGGASPESGAWSGPSGNQFFGMGLAVLPDGQRYAAPRGDCATAGYGFTIDPGASWRGAQPPYGRLPDRQCRVSFGRWSPEHSRGCSFSQ